MHPDRDREARRGALKLFDRNGSPATAPEEQENKERILLAAAALFANKGYAGTAVREIVEAAGVTKPTLYYYFKNKEDLYVKLMDEALDAFSLVLGEALARPGTMRERLTGLFSSLFELFTTHTDLLKLVNSMMYGSRGATPDYDFTSRSEELKQVFTEILEEGIEEGELEPQRQIEVLLLLTGLLRSMQVLLVMTSSPFPPLTPDLIERTVNVIFDGGKAAPLTQGGYSA